MTRTTRYILTIATLTAGLEIGRAASIEQPQALLTVRVYNHVGVPAGVMRPATQIAREIYRKIGIDTLWVSCMARDGQTVASLCATPPDVTNIRVQIGSETDATRFGAGPNSSGYAMPAKQGKFGSTTILFFNRISRQATESGVAIETLLGHMLAHEIAHLLLGRDPAGGDSHSKSGIMKAPWGRSELRLASTGALRFHNREKRRLISNAIARNRSEPLGTAPGLTSGLAEQESLANASASSRTRQP